MKSTSQTDFSLSGSLKAGDQQTDHHVLFGTASLGDYYSGNYTEISNDGTLRMRGSATVYDDLRVNLASLRSPVNYTPTYEVYNDMCELPAFSDSAFNRLYFTAQLPHSWKEGSDLKFHLHIANPMAIEQGETGNSYWKFEYSWANKDEIFVNSSALYKSIPHVVDDAGTHKIVPFATLSGQGKTLSSILICSIARLGNDNTNDTFALPVYGLQADFHYEIDSLGSNEEYIKT